MTAAAETLEVTVVRRDHGARRALRIAGSVALVGVGLLLDGAFDPLPSRDLVVRRRADGSEVLRGPVADLLLPALRRDVERDLQTFSEGEFLDRWRNPDPWEAALIRRWRPRRRASTPRDGRIAGR